MLLALLLTLLLGNSPFVTSNSEKYYVHIYTDTVPQRWEYTYGTGGGYTRWYWALESGWQVLEVPKHSPLSGGVPIYKTSLRVVNADSRLEVLPLQYVEDMSRPGRGRQRAVRHSGSMFAGDAEN